MEYCPRSGAERAIHELDQSVCGPSELGAPASAAGFTSSAAATTSSATIFVRRLTTHIVQRRSANGASPSAAASERQAHFASHDALLSHTRGEDDFGGRPRTASTRARLSAVNGAGELTAGGRGAAGSGPADGHARDHRERSTRRSTSTAPRGRESARNETTIVWIRSSARSACSIRLYGLSRAEV